MKIPFIFAAAACLVAAACGPFAPDRPKAPVIKPTIGLTLLPQDTLSPGKTTPVLAKLSHLDDRSLVGTDQLDTVHTQPFHLLVIDPTLSDYQHIHPQPTGTPGIYKFSFTPKLAGGYRAWADVTPTETHKQEFAMADLGAHRAGAIDKTERHDAAIGDYRFALSFDKPPVAGDESMGTIRITDGNGNPVTALEPVMGAFAHIVGFHEDFRTVVHTHPMGEEPKDDAQRGGPELIFHFAPEKPGFVKLFAQVKIGGRELFVPFGVNVGKGS